jgi:hypothetical protein
VTLFPPRPSTTVVLEFGQSSLKALCQGAGIDLPLERQTQGRLTPECCAGLILSLGKFLHCRGRRVADRALCAIGATGVSLRRVSLPMTSQENFVRLLTLQIEREFPLPPEELAWGWCPAAPNPPESTPSGSLRELVVVAVKREIVAQYAEVLTACGLNPKFTLSVWAASWLCPDPSGSYAILDIGRGRSEFMEFEQGVPASVRSIPWGGDDITRSIEQALGVSREEAEQAKLEAADPAAVDAQPGARILPGLEVAMGSLARQLAGSRAASRLFLAGSSARIGGLPRCLGQALGSVVCEPLDVPAGTGHSAAMLGLEKQQQDGGRRPPLIIQVCDAKPDRKPGRRSTALPWAALVVVLALGSFLLRYAEALIKQPGLARRLAEFESTRGEPPGIDRELSFLNYLETNRPPYLDLVSTLAESAPRGLRLDSLIMNRRGDLILRAKVQNPPQATEFRSNLNASGWLSNVVLEEQAPVPNQRQQVAVRLNARWQLATQPNSGFDSPARAATPPTAPRPDRSANPPGE